jgi:hypothetical protein
MAPIRHTANNPAVFYQPVVPPKSTTQLKVDQQHSNSPHSAQRARRDIFATSKTEG